MLPAGRVNRLPQPPGTNRDGSDDERSTHWVAFSKSLFAARKMFMNFCGLCSVSVNHVLCTCTIIVCPRRNV